MASNSNISTTSPANDPAYKVSTSSTIDELYIEEGIKKSGAYKNLNAGNIELLIEQAKKSLTESDEPVLQVIFEERFLPIHYVPELFM
ncbi:23267_t:CDS:2, partial [Dentiscutata erythropus]